MCFFSDANAATLTGGSRVAQDTTNSTYEDDFSAVLNSSDALANFGAGWFNQQLKMFDTPEPSNICTVSTPATSSNVTNTASSSNINNASSTDITFDDNDLALSEFLNTGVFDNFVQQNQNASAPSIASKLLDNLDLQDQQFYDTVDTTFCPLLYNNNASTGNSAPATAASMPVMQPTEATFVPLMNGWNQFFDPATLAQNALRMQPAQPVSYPQFATPTVQQQQSQNQTTAPRPNQQQGEKRKASQAFDEEDLGCRRVSVEDELRKLEDESYDEPERKKLKKSKKDDSKSKKKRLVWTPELHQVFVEAVNRLGVKTAAPKTILHFMGVDGLTTEHIKSHLQKYRQGLKKNVGDCEDMSSENTPHSYQPMPQTPVPSMKKEAPAIPPITTPIQAPVAPVQQQQQPMVTMAQPQPLPQMQTPTPVAVQPQPQPTLAVAAPSANNAACNNSPSNISSLLASLNVNMLASGVQQNQLTNKLTQIQALVKKLIDEGASSDQVNLLITGFRLGLRTGLSLSDGLLDVGLAK